MKRKVGLQRGMTVFSALSPQKLFYYNLSEGSQCLSNSQKKIVIELQVYKVICCKEYVKYLMVGVSTEFLRGLLVKVEYIVKYCSLRKRAFCN